MDPRTKHLSANRGSRTKPRRPGTLSVSGPVGANTSTTAADQARALRSADAQQQIPQDVIGAAQAGYGAGGFEGVQKSFGEDWYNLPEWQRTKILDASRG